MKLVIAGATGFVGKALLKQALGCSDITSIVTLGRRPVELEDADTAKVTDFVLDDLEHYPAALIEKLADADACIWTIAVTITKSMSTPFEVTKKVTYDYPMAGIKTLSECNKTGKSLRFIYISGAMVDRDLKKRPVFVPEYSLMRATVEIDLVEFAANSEGAVEVTCVRPGYILGDRGDGSIQPQLPPEVPTIMLEACVAAVLKQCVEGTEIDPVGNDELKRIGEEAVPKYFPRQ